MNMNKKKKCVNIPIKFQQATLNVNGVAARYCSEEFSKLSRSLDNRSILYKIVKRIFDIAFSGFVITVTFIPCAILSLAICIDTKGSPVYSQMRAGKWGRPFRIFKFRSMVADSDNVEKYFTPEQMAEWKRERKVENDPRITRLGRVMRKTSIDELPQFINVLLGQISVVGPRPITYEELSNFGDSVFRFLSVTPGITGEWQSGPRNTATFENGYRQQVELDYVEHASINRDLKIIIRTISAMFIKRSGK